MTVEGSATPNWFNSQPVEKLAWKKIVISPEEISPIWRTWFLLPDTWDQSCQDHLPRPSLIFETEGGQKGMKPLKNFFYSNCYLQTSEFYFVISDSWLGLENEVRSLIVSVWIYVCLKSRQHNNQYNTFIVPRFNIS